MLKKTTLQRSFILFAIGTICCALSLCASEPSSALSLWGSSGNADTARGYALVADGKIADAKAAFEAALKTDANDAAALDGLASVLVLGYGEQQRALELRAAAVRAAGKLPIAELAIDDCAAMLPYCRDPKPFDELVAGMGSLSAVNADVLRAAAVDWQLQRGHYAEALKLSQPLEYVHNWMLIGSFDNRDKSGFEREYEPEKEIDLERAVEGRNRRVRWFPVDVAPCDGKMVLSDIFEPRIHAIAYAATIVKAEQECQTVLRASCAGALKVFVNGKPAGAVPTYNDYGRDKLAAPVALRKGWNLILVKSAVVEETQWAFALRLCDFQGGALAGVSFYNSASALAEYKKETAPPPQYPLKKVFAREEDALKSRPQLGLLARLQQKVAANPQDAYVLTLLAVTMDARKLGEKNSSSTDLVTPASYLRRAIQLQPRNPFIPLELASVSEDSNEARSAVEGVLKDHKDLPYVYELLAFLAHESHSHIAAEDYAFAAWRRFHDAQPATAGLVLADELSGADRSFLTGASGESSSGKGSRAEAWNIAREITETHPYLAEGWTRRLPLEMTLSARRKMTESALEFCGGNAYLRQSRAQDLVRLGKDEEAAKVAAESLTALPLNMNGVLSAAEAFRRAGDDDAELRLLEGARKWAPENPDLLTALAYMRHRRGSVAEATALFKDVLAIKPNTPAVKDYLTTLEAKGNGVDRQFFAPYDVALKELPPVDSSAYPKDNSVVLLNQEVVRVNPNGSSSHMYHLVAKVLRVAGVQEVRNHYIWYEPERQTVDILRAAVITPDGREEARANISDHSTSAAEGVETLMYDEHHYKHVGFSALEPGSMIDLQYTVRDSGENLYGDYFADSFHFTDGRPTARAEYVLDYPKSLTMQTQALHTKLDAARLDSKDTERETLQWELKNIASLERETLMPPPADSLPQVQATTMRSWHDVGSWFWNLSQEQVVVNDEMRAEIGKLCENCKSDTEKLRAVHDWVIKKIRYLGIEFGRNGYKPHRATETYKSLYGDCKDTATLVTAMLKSIGIDSRLVLIRTRNVGAIPADSLPLPNLFNHCIAYVPNVDGKAYWIDGTTDFYRLGEVPALDCGTQVLVAGPTGGEFLKVPEGSSKLNTIEQNYDVKVAAEGPAQLKLHDIRSGFFAPLLRESIDTPGKFETRMREYAAQHFNGAKLTAIKSSDVDSQGPAWSDMELNVPSMITHGGDEMTLPATFESLGMGQRYARDVKRTHDILMQVPWSRKTEITYRLDETLNVQTLPEDAQLDKPFGKFNRTVKRDGNNVTISEFIELPMTQIPVKDYKDFRAFCQRVDTLMDQKVVMRAR